MLCQELSFFTDTNTSEINFNNARLVSGKVKSANLNFTIRNQIEEILFVDFLLVNGFDENGNVFVETLEIPEGTRSLPSVVQGSFLIQNLEVDFQEMPTSLAMPFNLFLGLNEPKRHANISWT